MHVPRHELAYALASEPSFGVSGANCTAHVVADGDVSIACVPTNVLLYEADSIEVPALPINHNMCNWRLELNRAIAAALVDPHGAMKWVGKVDEAKTNSELSVSDGFCTLDAKLAVGLLKVLTPDLFRRIAAFEVEYIKSKKMFRGRQILFEVYKYFSITDAKGAGLDLNNLLDIEIINDDPNGFQNKCTTVLSALRGVPDKERILEPMLFLQLKKSKSLKDSIAVYKSEARGDLSFRSYNNLYQLLSEFHEDMLHKQLNGGSPDFTPLTSKTPGEHFEHDNQGRGNTPKGPGARFPKLGGTCERSSTPSSVQPPSGSPKGKVPSKGLAERRGTSPSGLPNRKPCPSRSLGRFNKGDSCNVFQTSVRVPWKAGRCEKVTWARVPRPKPQAAGRTLLPTPPDATGTRPKADRQGLCTHLRG